MQIKKLLAFRPSQLLIPIKNKDAWPDGFRDHIIAHVVGAIGLYFLLLPLHLITAYLVFLFALLWQLVLEEMHSTVKMDLPIWSMVWDIATMTITALLMNVFI